MKYLIFFITLLMTIGCSPVENAEPSEVAQANRHVSYKKIPKLNILEDEEVGPDAVLDLSTFNQTPKEWGENVTGVKTQFATHEKEIALTFDLCGGDTGNGFDQTLVDFLREAEVPATLFVNERWIAANEQLFLELAADPLFQIENHGTEHAPLSVEGKSAWGIPGTNSPEEVFNEIMENHNRVKELTGRDMTLFRSGTAYYDEVAVSIAQALGYEVVNFDILGDAGATYSASQVEQALLGAKPGSIVLLHMNQPNSGTAQGVIAAVPKLRAEGFQFVHLAGKELK